jgi:hypothetical protein
MKRFLLIALLFTVPVLSSCAANPVPVSPATQAVVAATQVIKALDVVRDTAIDLNATVPPILSTAVTTKIINFHESAVKTIMAVPGGWKSTVLAAIGQLQGSLTPAEFDHIAPYVTLVQTLIASVP